jgi:CheY-like chemotaxis protein
LKISNTILFIDEDEVMHYLIQIILDKFKLSGKVKSAFNGKEALEYLQVNASENNFPKLIITNFCLKGMKGIDLIKAIIGMKGYSAEKTEIFVLSPELKEEEVKELNELGISKILPKPELPQGLGRLRS